MPNRALLGQIGYMAQDDSLYDALTGEENLRFFGRMKGVKKDALTADIAHVADVVDLTPDLKKRVSGYSGGMRRQLSLAIALLGDPELLVLDERLSALIRRCGARSGTSCINCATPAAAS